MDSNEEETTTPSTTTTMSPTTTTTENPLAGCDFHEIVGGLQSCSCYNFSLTAFAVDGTYYGQIHSVTVDTELTDEGDALKPIGPNGKNIFSFFDHLPRYSSKNCQ